MPQNSNFFFQIKNNHTQLFQLLRSDDCDIVKEKNLISTALENQPGLLAYFLNECNSLSSTKIEVVLKNLIKLKAFNAITINQSIVVDTTPAQRYSVSYLLLSSVEGRKILNENPQLCDLIGEELTIDQLQQFVNGTSYDGILYYLLTDEVGREILKKHSTLQEKVLEIDEEPYKILSIEITGGPHKGKVFRDLFENLLTNSPDMQASLSH